MTEIIDLLQSVPLFEGISQNGLEHLKSHAHLQTVKGGSLVFHQGDVAKYFMIVVQGRFRLIQHTIEGKDVTMSMFTPGDPIGLIVALTNDPYPGSVEALEDGSALIIPGKIIWPLMELQPNVAIRIVRILADRLHDAHNRIRELSTERVQQRIARSTVRLAEKLGVQESKDTIRLDLSLSRQDLAQMSGTTLETVSRTLTNWEHQGIVHTGREQLTILKFNDLLTIAEGCSTLPL